MPTLPKLPKPPKLPANAVSAVTRQVAGWMFTSVYIPTIVVRALLADKEERSVLGPHFVRTWGSTMSRIAGVDVVFTPRAQAALGQRTPRVLTFNHGSTLDVLTGAALLPEGGVLVVKQEMNDVPLLGAGCRAIGSVFLERGNREKAYASLQAAAARMHAERLQLLIAPEGTRSEDGNLGPFKLGAFHLAAVSGAPILPIVLHDHVKIWPMGQFAPNRGSVTIDTLAPVTLDPDEDLRDAADRLRLRYVEALAAGPNASD